MLIKRSDLIRNFGDKSIPAAIKEINEWLIEARSNCELSLDIDISDPSINPVEVRHLIRVFKDAGYSVTKTASTLIIEWD